MSSVLEVMRRSHGNSVLVKGGSICKVSDRFKEQHGMRLHHFSKKKELSDSTGEPYLVFNRGRFVPGEKNILARWLLAWRERK